MTRIAAALAVLGSVLALQAGPASAQPAAQPVFNGVEAVPVQEGGRVKPFDTHARETLRDICGKDTWDGWSATMVALSMAEDGDTWRAKPIIRVDHLELKDKFAMERARKYYSFQELLGNRDFLTYAEDLRQSGREDFDDLEKAALETYTKMVTLDRATQKQTPHLVPGVRDKDAPWMSVAEMESMQGAPFVAQMLGEWNAVRTAALHGDEAALTAALAQWSATVSAQPGFALADDGRNELEVLYNQADPFRKAWILYVVSFVIFLAGWTTGNRVLGFVALFPLMVGFLAHSGGLLLRQWIAGRPPISNLYESLTFIVWGIVAIAIIYEMSNRKRVFGTIAAVLGSIGMVLAETLPIERELNPLVAVLRSYWMQYHVTTILLSYSALTLAAGLAHFHLALKWFAPAREALARKTAQLLYTMMKVGITLLAAGVILGAIWASDSWGRYWGWDPKETWSLITLVGYLAIVHGRFAGWLTPYGVSVANVACWGLVLFTYYGVNFFLVGLHSYAGGAAAVKLPPLLIVYLLFELVVIGVGIWYTKSGRLSAGRAASA